jgi:hypothetical protein
MKFLIMQSSTASRHFLRLTSKYSPRHMFLIATFSIISYFQTFVKWTRDRVVISSKLLEVARCNFVLGWLTRKQCGNFVSVLINSL